MTNQLSIEHDIFEPMKIDFNEILHNTISTMIEKGQDEGTMNIKISIELRRTAIAPEAVYVPTIAHEIKSSMKIQQKLKGKPIGVYQLRVSDSGLNLEEINRQIGWED